MVCLCASELCDSLRTASEIWPYSNAGQNVRAQIFGPDRVARGTWMDAVHGHAHRRRRFWVPVQDASALPGQHPGQGFDHLSCPTAHEPTQRLWQGQAGMHGRRGAVRQQCRPEVRVDQRGQAILPTRPLKRAEQTCRIVGADQKHHHIEARGRCFFQQLEPAWRVQFIGGKHTPVHRVMRAQDLSHPMSAADLVQSRLGRHRASLGKRTRPAQ